MIITFCGHSRIGKDVKDKTKKERIFAPLIFISSTMTQSVNSCRRQFMKALPSIHAIFDCNSLHHRCVFILEIL